MTSLAYISDLLGWNYLFRASGLSPSIAEPRRGMKSSTIVVSEDLKVNEKRTRYERIPACEFVVKDYLNVDYCRMNSANAVPSNHYEGWFSSNVYSLRVDRCVKSFEGILVRRVYYPLYSRCLLPARASILYSKCSTMIALWDLEQSGLLHQIIKFPKILNLRLPSLSGCGNFTRWCR